MGSQVKNKTEERETRKRKANKKRDSTIDTIEKREEDTKAMHKRIEKLEEIFGNERFKRISGVIQTTIKEVVHDLWKGIVKLNFIN